MEEKKRRYLLLLMFSIFALLIGIEVAYRQPLFDQSLIWIQDFQTSLNTKSAKDFFNFITYFGTVPLLIPMFIVVFNWLNLSQSFAYFRVFIISVYVDNLFKLIYSSPRPFFINSNITPFACDGGYGNPSGHAYSSSACYLAFWHVTTDNDFFKKHVWLRIIYFIFVVLLVFIICLSRYYLGVHSLNQLIYGSSLGVSTYITILLVLESDKLDSKAFFDHFRNLYWNIFNWSLYILLFIVLLLVYFLKNYDNSLNYRALVECPDLALNRYFQYDGLTNALVCFALMGFHLGLSILCLIMGKIMPDSKFLEERIHDFRRTTFLKSLGRLLVFAVVAIPTLLPYLLISNKASLGIIYVLKISAPYFVTLTTVNSLGIYLNLRFNLIYSEENYLDINKSNQDIEMKAPSEKLE